MECYWNLSKQEWEVYLLRSLDGRKIKEGSGQQILQVLSFFHFMEQVKISADIIPSGYRQLHNALLGTHEWRSWGFFCIPFSDVCCLFWVSQEYCCSSMYQFREILWFRICRIFWLFCQGHLEMFRLITFKRKLTKIQLCWS